MPVVYYNDVAAYQLGKIWKDPFQPDLKAAQFPEGSMVVKVEAATLNEVQWPVLKNSSVSHIYRPPVESLSDKDPMKRVPVVTPMRFLQMAVRVKDSRASPKTGWVFIAFCLRHPLHRRHGVGPRDPRSVRCGATIRSWPTIANGLGPEGRVAGDLGH